MNDLSKSWMVTFFYEQELRSYYMNGVLNGILSPGIHNANLSIYTVDNYRETSSGQQSSGIYLHIKKGSTFIFSNNYKTTDDGKIIRDNNSIGTFLIKCVALEDITYDLYRWESRFPWGDNEKAMLGADRDAVYYVVASLRYNPNQGTGKPDEESGAPKFLAPTFSIVKSNNLYDTEITQGDSLYYKGPGIGPNKIEEELTEGVGIPDGSKNYFGNKDTILNHIAWLMVGSIIESPDRRERDAGYINNENWVGGAEVDWTKNHVFTGRGLPEYRRSFENNIDGMNPDFIISPYLNKLFMDLGAIYDDSILYYQRNDWNEVNSIATPLVAHPSSSKSNPKKVWPSPAGNITIDHSFDISAKEWASIIKTVNDNPAYKKSLDSINDEFTFLVADAVFLNSKKHSSNMKINIEDILTTSLTSLTSDGNKLPIKSVRWVCNPGTYNFKPAYDSEDQEGSSEITHKNYSYDAGKLKNKIIMPLDVCSANINRLRNIIANKNFIVTLVDILRRENLIESTSGDSLIPICIAFRKFKATVSKGSPLTVNTPCISVDNISTKNYIHPANILSFFDIQNNSTKANSINFKASNVYTVLPVID